MIHKLLLFLFMGMGFLHSGAQTIQQDIIVKRIEIREPELKEKQPLKFYKGKEFHLYFTDDLNKKLKKKKNLKFYVDFLAERQKIKGDYMVEIRWLQVQIYDPIPRTTTSDDFYRVIHNIGRQPEVLQISPDVNTVYEYRAEALLEIVIYKHEESGLKTAHQIQKQVLYNNFSAPNEENRNLMNMDKTVKKPQLFKEMCLKEYDYIRDNVMAFFNGLN